MKQNETRKPTATPNGKTAGKTAVVATDVDTKTTKAEYQRSWRKAHSDKVREYKRKYRLTHKKAEREYKRRYRLTHKSEILEREREYRAAHPEKHREYTRKYQNAHPLRNVWRGILRRTGVVKCTNPKSLKRYQRYISRGITVCAEWRKFANFEAWAIANGWMRGLEIDRIDNNGNYEPSNCRFVTRVQNVRNRENTAYVVFNGTRMPLVEAIEVSGCGLSYNTVHDRIHKYKWPIERALTERPNEKISRKSQMGGVA